MDEQSSGSFHDKESRVDGENDDEDVFMLLTQAADFTCFGLSTSIHRLRIARHL
jgi:hypothetical protein